MSKQSDLAGSLATVAIATLGGPLFVVRAGLGEVVKYAQSRYDESEQSRQIRKQVAGAVARWADSEKLSDSAVDLGLALAAEKVAHYGLSLDALAKLTFDPVQAADTVVAAAKADDPRWGTEDHYLVATRAIGITYEGLITELRAREGMDISAFLELRSSIDEQATLIEDKFRLVAASLEDLVEALTGAGTVSEVKAYLRARIVDWDVSVWHYERTASAVERPLKVRRQGSPKDSWLLDSDEVLAFQEMLVILGGPGAGKTGLCRRYARMAAQSALNQLEDGAGLDEVELPLLTTWEQWTKATGSPMQSLVASSFASGLGHSDVGVTGTLERLTRTFLRAGARVLLVVDSLDEAADMAAQGPRLLELQGLPAGWRVVVASRSAAWYAAHRGTAGRTPHVVELIDLSYPKDVEAVIYSWFREAPDPGRADALVREIRSRPELVRTAVVPLMLSFYCLLAENPPAISTPLPARRRELYRRLVRRLLRGAWAASHPGPDAAPDSEYCEELLRSWAWEAVRGRTSAVGLGEWGDTFTQPTVVRQAERRAVDHIAPKTADDDEGSVTRRFIHRTFLEHFVAEYISTLETSKAADMLLPHLWFDPDWQVAAPAAIAAHNQQAKGALLPHLLNVAMEPATDAARQVARSEFDRLLLAVAQESEPDEWSQEHQDMFNRCRVDNALHNLHRVARSAHWTDSNLDVLRAVLASEMEYPLTDVVDDVLTLASTDDIREQARGAVVKALSAVDSTLDKNLANNMSSFDVRARLRSLARVLLVLAPTDGELTQTRSIVLKALSVERDWLTEELIQVFKDLSPLESELAQTRANLLKAICISEFAWDVKNLIEVLLLLLPTKAERAQARSAVFRVAEATDEPWWVPDLVDVLPRLALTKGELAETRKAALAALSRTSEPFRIEGLTSVLPALAPVELELNQARKTVLDVLSAAADTGYSHVSVLVRSLLTLGPTAAERAQALAIVLNALSVTDEAGYLIDVLPELARTESELKTARAAVLAAPAVVLVRGMPALAPTSAELAQARAAVLKDLTARTKPWEAEHDVKVLMSLVPDGGEVERARATALDAVLELTSREAAFGNEVEQSVTVLMSLAPTDAQLKKARAAVLKAALSQDSARVVDLVRALLPLEPTTDERTKARTAILKALSTTDVPRLTRELVELLTAMGPNNDERAQARTAMLKALSFPPSPSDPVLGEWSESSRMVKALRSTLMPDLWMAWLADRS